MTSFTKPGIRPTASAFAAAAIPAALVVGNVLAARRAERRHPPRGSFIEVGGVRLHYTDRGQGSPVVLIHGNAVSGSDWEISGVAGLLGEYRVITFDRPGFGHSQRPRGRLWTAAEQADLFAAALRELGITRPAIVGHSWGTIVALAMAERHPTLAAGLVLVSGYYFWTVRPDVPLVAMAAVPVFGDILRHTVLPLLGWLQMPLLKRALFSPAAVTARFEAGYSTGMALRPSTIRATAIDGVTMIPGVLALRGQYGDLSLPVTVIAGAGDKLVFKRNSERLAASIPGCRLQIVQGAGHMVHHLEPRRIAQAIGDVVEASRAGGQGNPVGPIGHDRFRAA